MDQSNSEEVKQSNNKKKKISLVVLGVVILVGAVTLFFYLRYKSTHISTDDAFIDGDIHTIASKVPGTVSKIYVRSNQYVKKSDSFCKPPGIQESDLSTGNVIMFIGFFNILMICVLPLTLLMKRRKGPPAQVGMH
ncbi:MAG: biotin/lipoyl-binding protein [Nitrospirota bacterium]